MASTRTNPSKTKKPNDHAASSEGEAYVDPQFVDENPNAREDFMRLANAAARKQPQGE